MRERMRLIAVSVGLVVVLLLLYLLMIRPRQGELDDLKVQVANEQNTTTTLELELARLQALQENEAELEAELAAIRELVPQKDEVANFIFLVEEAADQAGVDFVTITPELPKPPPEGAPLAEVRFAINAGGGFFSIQDFLRRLYELDRALRIDLLAMAGEADTGSSDTIVNLDITGRIFFELPAGGGNPAPDPTAPTTAPPPQPVSSPAPVESEAPAAEASPSVPAES